MTRREDERFRNDEQLNTQFNCLSFPNDSRAQPQEINTNGPDSWILDSGATDHMTFEVKDLSSFSKPRRKYISNANGGLSSNIICDNVTPSYVLPNRTTRGKPPNRYSPDIENKKSKYPVANFVAGELSESLRTFTRNLAIHQIPKDIHEALADPRWREAVQEEMKSFYKSDTWNLEELPRDKRTVGCRWIFTIKYQADGSIERYKARLVAKGYTQIYGVDYEETFSPVVKLSTVRVILSIAANLDWPLHQFDVKNAFLHGELEEEVYMDIPPGFETNTKLPVVCKLKKAIYGLKQSPRAWFGRFSSAMKGYGYKQCNSDHSLFIKRKNGKITTLLIYVDDMIISGDDVEEITELQEALNNDFEMKNLGGLKYFLGIEVARSNQGIFISQRKYVLDLLAETGMLDCKPADTPMIQNLKLKLDSDQKLTDKKRYQRLVGKLIYLSYTRPDIAFAVSVVSKFMHQPREDHMDVVIRIIRYLKSSPGKGLIFTKNNHVDIEGYTDADWAGDINDRRSTSGYFTFVGGNLVSWQSKKQKVVALSSAEAELRGMKKGICHLMWLKELMTEIGFAPLKAMELHCDNKAAISMVYNPVQHERTKHVGIDRNFIRENIDMGIIKFLFVKSEDQTADILTKATGGERFHQMICKLGMRDLHTPT